MFMQCGRPIATAGPEQGISRLSYGMADRVTQLHYLSRTNHRPVGYVDQPPAFLSTYTSLEPYRRRLCACARNYT